MKRKKQSINKRIPLSEVILPKTRTLYFNEEEHKYKDDLDNVYTSVTTLIHKYVNVFDQDAIAAACERAGKNPNHKNYLKYKGKSKKQILYEWSVINKEACDKGTMKHNFLEGVIKQSSDFKSSKPVNGYSKLYTIDDILKLHGYGVVNLSSKQISELHDKYPTIYGVIKDLSDIGFKIYAEIAVYDYDSLISGLIDVLAVRGDEFIIVDWKTNNAPIRFEAGYFEKDIRGNITDVYIPTNKYLKHPLEHMQDSVGNHYTLQLSLYAYLVESFGLRCIGIMLVHILTKKATTMINGEIESTDNVIHHKIQYIKDDVKLLVAHHNSLITTTNTLF